MIRPFGNAVVSQTSRIAGIMAPLKRSGHSCLPDSPNASPPGGHYGAEHTGKLQAAAQTAGQAASDVWMVTVLDFTSGELRRLIVPRRISRQRPPQKDAGNARLEATAEEKQANH